MNDSKVLQAARLGFQAHGIELNLWLVLFSRARSLLGGLSDTATFSRQDLWKADLSRFDDVVIFGGEDMVIFLLFFFLKRLRTTHNFAAH